MLMLLFSSMLAAGTCAAAQHGGSGAGRQEVATDRICAAVREFIRTKAPWEPKQMHIRPIRFRQKVTVPEGTLQLAVAAPKHTDWLGSMLFAVRILVDGRIVKKVSVPVAIEVHGPVVVAAKPIGRNQPIAPDDIRVVEMNLARAPADAVGDPLQVIGHKAKRAIAVNAVMRGGQVESPPVVRRGDVVKILAESSALMVVAQGMAKQDGAAGERIQVMNMSSRKLISAQVMDAHTVRVQF